MEADVSIEKPRFVSTADKPLNEAAQKEGNRNGIKIFLRIKTHRLPSLGVSYFADWPRESCFRHVSFVKICFRLRWPSPLSLSLVRSSSGIFCPFPNFAVPPILQATKRAKGRTDGRFVHCAHQGTMAASAVLYRFLLVLSSKSAFFPFLLRDWTD